MDLYEKVEKVIQDHINEHKEEVRKGKEMMGKLDVLRYNQPEITATGEEMPVEDGLERKSIYWHDYTRNDPNRENPFEPKTVTSGASCYDPKAGYRYSSDALFHIPDYTEL